MFSSKNYAVITEEDKFNADDYPEIVNELIGIKARLGSLSFYYSNAIVISFFKDHSIKCIFINENPEVCKAVAGGSLSAQHIELLFASCRHNKVFLWEYEHFIKQALL